MKFSFFFTFEEFQTSNHVSSFKSKAKVTRVITDSSLFPLCHLLLVNNRAKRIREPLRNTCFSFQLFLNKRCFSLVVQRRMVEGKTLVGTVIRKEQVVSPKTLSLLSFNDIKQKHLAFQDKSYQKQNVRFSCSFINMRRKLFCSIRMGILFVLEKCL